MMLNVSGFGREEQNEFVANFWDKLLRLGAERYNAGDALSVLNLIDEADSSCLKRHAANSRRARKCTRIGTITEVKNRHLARPIASGFSGFWLNHTRRNNAIGSG